jgi:hypothetical protein
MSDQQLGEKFDGLASTFNDSRFINFETMEGKGDVVLTIKEVVFLGPDFKFENGKKIGKKTLCLKFEKTDKVLRLNTGNRRLVKQQLGNETKKWVGEKVVLYGDPNVRFGRNLVGGVKVRD